MADEQSLPIDPFQASAAIAEAHAHDAELIALAGRMGLHSLSSEQLSALQSVPAHPFNTTPVASHESASVEVKDDEDGPTPAGIEANRLHAMLRAQLTPAPQMGQSTRENPGDLPQQVGTRPFAATVAARWAVDPEFRQACRDEGLAAPQIPVTDQMRAAMIAHPIARHVLDDGLLLSFYRAMAALAPVELVSANEDRIAALETECEALSAALHAEIQMRDDHVLGLRGDLVALEAENAELVTENKRLADGPPTRHPPEYVAKVLMDREGRHNDPFAHARLTEVIRCARLDGRKQARDVALEIIAANEDRIAALETECEALSAALHAEIQMRDDHVLGLRGDLAALEAANADRAETERRLGNLLARASDERQELLDRLTEAYLERDERDIVILAKEERIAELKSELAMRVTTKPTAAQQTATDLKPTNEPKAMPANALKPAPTDRRRIGG